MRIAPAMDARTIALARKAVIVVLAGLLIFYHCFTLYELFFAAGSGTPSTYEYVQAILRIAIILALSLVVFGVRPALWAMWASITGLVATHYWAHFGHLPVDFTEGRHPLSYLKGFIFPTIITIMFRPVKGESVKSR